MRSRVDATLAGLEEDAFQPRLQTHKLTGELQGRYACSVAYDTRIVFRIESDPAGELIVLLSIGTHDEVY